MQATLSGASNGADLPPPMDIEKPLLWSVDPPQPHYHGFTAVHCGLKEDLR